MAVGEVLLETTKCGPVFPPSHHNFTMGCWHSIKLVGTQLPLFEGVNPHDGGRDTELFCFPTIMAFFWEWFLNPFMKGGRR